MSDPTVKILRDAARVRGMVFDKADGEYRIAWPKDEASAYYTNCARDALATMCAMYTAKIVEARHG